ncbi:MAG: hypothetical protein JSV47_14100 [Deltaproteobacteria bacterium]|nr:MAG: hypothetical protein JSV47_14100 [Deltaproteobacteria bacterium]
MKPPSVNLNQEALSLLKESISRLVNKPIHLTITDNTHSMIHIRSFNRGYKVRLHHMFLEADDEILNSLASFITGRKRKAPSVLRDFVASNSDKIRNASPKGRQTLLRHHGRYFNIKELFDQLNYEYFSNNVNCQITWGANRRVSNQNSIKLASYSDITKTIRINPALDKSYVPHYVVKGVIYHEMLHHYLGVELQNGRKMAHSKTFRKHESRYKHYQKLQEWKEKNLNRLLGR